MFISGKTAGIDEPLQMDTHSTTIPVNLICSRFSLFLNLIFFQDGNFPTVKQKVPEWKQKSWKKKTTEKFSVFFSSPETAKCPVSRPRRVIALTLRKKNEIFIFVWKKDFRVGCRGEETKSGLLVVPPSSYISYLKTDPQQVLIGGRHSSTSIFYF